MPTRKMRRRWWFGVRDWFGLEQQSGMTDSPWLILEKDRRLALLKYCVAPLLFTALIILIIFSVLSIA